MKVLAIMHKGVAIHDTSLGMKKTRWWCLTPDGMLAADSLDELKAKIDDWRKEERP